MKPLNWKVAAAGGTLLGVGLGGFALASDDQPVVVPEEVRLRCQKDADNFGPNSVSENIFRALLRKVHRLDSSYES